MSILAKIGLKDINSNLATALRTIVVVVFAWLLVFITGANESMTTISQRSLVFLILSGVATGGSWLCYFKALQIGDVNKVVPIDKSSTVLTMLLSMIFLGESITIIKIVAMILIGIGTYMMIEKKQTNSSVSNSVYRWLIYASLSAIFVSLTAILGKVGVEGVDSNLGTAIRTLVILVMSWGSVMWQGTHREVQTIDKKSWLFILFSGIATGLLWFFYYRALQEGVAGVVVPIDKLSILVTIGFCYFVLHERMEKKQFTD